MALWLDQKYVNLASTYLEKFRKVDTGLWNFRCPYCGDSQKNKSKCRGYLYTKSQSIFYSCKNCDAATTLCKFLEHISSQLASEYRRESYLESREYSPQRPKKSCDESTLIIPKIPSRFIKQAKPIIKDQFNGKFDRLDILDEDHEAVQYILNRKIPRSQLHKMYYISSMRDICDIPGFGKYEDRVNGYEPRIILPFFNISGMMTGITCRAIRGESFRYVALKLVDDEPMIFGVDEIDFDEDIYVTEGSFDSMFVKNCIAVGGTGMTKLDSLGIDKNKLIIVFDNQPRNKQIVHIIEKTILCGYNVVIWSERFKYKDINDAIVDGYELDKIVDQLQNRVYNGLQAKVKFNLWRKV